MERFIGIGGIFFLLGIAYLISNNKKRIKLYSKYKVKHDKLLKQANNRIELIPGSGVNIHNVKKFIDAGFKNIHLSSKMNIKSKMEYQANLSMTASSNISSFDYIGVDLQKLNQFVSYVRKNEKL